MSWKSRACIGQMRANSRSVRASVDSLGSATAYDLAATILPTRGMRQIPKVRIDGIIGTGLFERFLATLDYPKARLVLRLRSAAISAQFEASAATAGAAIEPCWLVGDHIVVAKAQVNDAPAGLFLFYSGLAGGGLMPSPQPSTRHILTSTGQKRAPEREAAVLSSRYPLCPARSPLALQCNITLPASIPRAEPFSPFPFTIGGIISHNFLLAYAYTVDFDAMKLVLSSSSIL